MDAFEIAWSILKGNPNQISPYRVINRLAHQQNAKRQMVANERMSEGDHDLDEFHLEDYPEGIVDELASPYHMAEFAQNKPATMQQITEMAEALGPMAEQRAMQLDEPMLSTMRRDPAVGDAEMERQAIMYNLGRRLPLPAGRNVVRKPMPTDPSHNRMNDAQAEDALYLDMKGYKFDHPRDLYTAFDDGFEVDNYYTGPFASDDEF